MTLKAEQIAASLPLKEAVEGSSGRRTGFRVRHTGVNPGCPSKGWLFVFTEVHLHHLQSENGALE